MSRTVFKYVKSTPALLASSLGSPEHFEAAGLPERPGNRIVVSHNRGFRPAVTVADIGMSVVATPKVAPATERPRRRERLAPPQSDFAGSDRCPPRDDIRTHMLPLARQRPIRRSMRGTGAEEPLAETSPWSRHGRIRAATRRIRCVVGQDSVNSRKQY